MGGGKGVSRRSGRIVEEESFAHSVPDPYSRTGQMSLSTSSELPVMETLNDVR